MWEIFVYRTDNVFIACDEKSKWKLTHLYGFHIFDAADLPRMKYLADAHGWELKEKPALVKSAG